MQLHLGTILKDGKVINHRTMFKILCNPFLRRYFGCCVASMFEKNEFLYYTLMKGTKSKRSLLEELKASWFYA